jgi:hypothetical protein
MDAKALVEQYQQLGLSRESIKLKLEQQGFNKEVIDDAMQHLPTINWDNTEPLEPAKNKGSNAFSIITGVIMIVFGFYRGLGSGIMSIVGFIFVIAGVMNIIYAIKNTK